MSKAQMVMTGLLLLTVVFSGLAVVNAKNSSRDLFVLSQSLSRAADDLDIDWGRLQLEHGAWGTPSRVQKLAEEQLAMHMPLPAEVVVLGGVDGH